MDHHRSGVVESEGEAVGIMRAFVCERCSLAFEIGGYTYWDLDGRREQAVCTACGTMHRLDQRDGICRVTALPGPLQFPDPPTMRTPSGDEYPLYDWSPLDADWPFVGHHAGGIAAFGLLACNRCREPGRMQSLTYPPHPDGFWVSFREVCPLCEGSMPCVQDSTVN